MINFETTMIVIDKKIICFLFFIWQISCNLYFIKYKNNLFRFGKKDKSVEDLYFRHIIIFDQTANYLFNHNAST